LIQSVHVPHAYDTTNAVTQEERKRREGGNQGTTGENTTMPPSQKQSPPIFLLKTAATPRDLYEEFFRKEFYLSTQSHGYDPVFVPVLSHRMHAENLARVESFFTSHQTHQTHQNDDGDDEEEKAEVGSFIGENPTYGGMIFTSQRAVEAFRDVLEQGNIAGTYTSRSQSLEIFD
jgi:hypothetical protein